MVLEKLDSYMWKNESRTPSNTYTEIKWIKDLECKPSYYKLLEENTGRAPFAINHSRIFFDLPPNEDKSKIKE